MKLRRLIAFAGILALLSACEASPGARGPGASQPSARDDVAVRVRNAIQTHCIKCHAAGSKLDLLAQLETGGPDEWGRIRAAVESGRMPLPSGSPFPMDPAQRESLARDLDALSQTRVRPTDRTVVLSATRWMSVVGDISAPYLSETELHHIFRTHQGGIGDRGAHARFDWPVARVNVLLISRDVCEKVVVGLSRAGWRVAGDAGSGAASQDDWRAVRARALFKSAYAREPSEPDLAAGRAALDDFRRETGDREQAAVALCTAYLSGPRMFLLQVHDRTEELNDETP